MLDEEVIYKYYLTVCYAVKMYLWSYGIYDKTIEHILQKCNVNTRENNELDNAAT